MSELVTTIRQAVAELAHNDRGFRRFGAAQHHYELAPPLTLEAVLALETDLGATLPDEYRDFVLEVSAGGAGPAYGLFTADRAARFAIRKPAAVKAGVLQPTSAKPTEPWSLAIPLAHWGCGYAIVLPLDGPARGQIWLHARAIDLVATIRPSFSAYYVDWIDRLARNAMPDSFIPPDACALPAALTGYLGVWERRLGVDPGSLAGDALASALSHLGEGAIELAAESAAPLFAPGDRVDPCLTCARLVEQFGSNGLTRQVIAPGVPPLPMRPAN